MDNLIHERGYWLTDTAKGHAHDAPLRDSFIKWFKEQGINSVLDLGCGPGYYTIGFKQAQLDCDGYDGNPNTPQLTKNHCKVLDLTLPIELEKQYDCVLSLEVGEHIPKEFETTFLDNIIKNCKDWLIISWAVPGQHGTGHVNCQTNEYIESQLLAKNFTRVQSVECIFRETAKCGWFKNTIMVFRKNS